MAWAWVLLLWLPRRGGVEAFGGLLEDRSERDFKIAREAMSSCEHALGHTLGAAWLGCVFDTLDAWQVAALAAGRDDYYPVAPHDVSPWGLKPGGVGGFHRSEELKNWLRDYSCDAGPPASAPIGSRRWEYVPPPPCTGGSSAGAFVYHNGYLPAGDDMEEMTGRYTEAEAAEACGKAEACAGFTFSSPARAAGASHTMYFKNYSTGARPSAEWHSFKRRENPALCEEGRPPRLEEYEVRVLREVPPVFLVPNFVGAEDCDRMVNMTVPQMTRSVVSGGRASQERRSYSVNMYPDFEDNTNTVTKLSHKLFQFAREVAGYTSLYPNAGQEPVNAVFYKDYDDQYRAHCDGECRGGLYREGRRIATALVYCQAPEEGGATLFTRSGLKVLPEKGTMLFFGYKLNGSTMDNGHTEHSGCPLRKGRKWIATMWFREGVTPENDWQSMNDL
ncbi:hypothetical protein AB1Y20_011153 [Prymnesium parvum]|uniref:Fe2OG dioxygenase domain-containing protein n=1 Tax=Prymnesium parvum TaxID=97485 RepID=A0AB34IMI5_PRYPA